MKNLRIREVDQTKIIEIEKDVILPQINFSGDCEISKIEMEILIQQTFLNTTEMECSSEDIQKFEIPDKIWESWSPEYHYPRSLNYKKLIKIDPIRFVTFCEDGFGYFDQWDDLRLTDKEINKMKKYFVLHLIGHINKNLSLVDKKEFKSTYVVINSYKVWDEKRRDRYRKEINQPTELEVVGQ